MRTIWRHPPTRVPWQPQKARQLTAIVSVQSFTATAALNVGAISFAGSGTVENLFSATAAPEVGGVEFAATGTVENLFTATSAVENSGVTLAATATHDDPNYTGEANPVVGGTEFASTSTFTPAAANVYAQAGYPEPFLSGYAMRKRFTIDRTNLSGTAVDAIVRIKFAADSQIAAAAHSTGQNIRFTKEDGTTLLPYTRLEYASGAGDFLVLYDGSLTVGGSEAIIAYIDNSSASDGSSPTTTFDTSNGIQFRASMDQSPAGGAGSILDSTSNANHGTPAGSMDGSDVITAILLNGLEFDGTDDKVTFGVTNLPTIQGNKTMSCWVRMATVGAGTQQIFTLSDNTANSRQLELRNTFFTVSEWGGGTLVSSGFTPEEDVWYYIVYTWDGTTHRIYVDGVEAANSTTASSQTGTPSHLFVGTWGTAAGTEYLSGAVDEARVHNIALSAHVIKFQYFNYTETDYEITKGPLELPGGLVVGGTEFAATSTFSGANTYSSTAALEVGGTEFSATGTVENLFQATAALLAGNAEFAGTGTVENLFTATAAVENTGATFAGTATHNDPDYTATSALTVGGADFAATADNTDIEYTAEAALLVGGAEVAATAIFATVVYSATAAINTGGADGASTATFTLPTYSATAAPTTGGADLAATGTHNDPDYTATAALLTGGADSASSSSFVNVIFAGTAALTTGGADSASTATHDDPSYTSTAALEHSGATVASTAIFAGALFAATADLITGGTEFDAIMSFIDIYRRRRLQINVPDQRMVLELTPDRLIIGGPSRLIIEQEP